MRICAKCGEQVDGPRCIPCRKAWMTKWTAKNADVLRAKAKRRREENPEKKKEYMAKWLEKNREKMRRYLKTYSRKWRLANKQKMKEYGEKWRAKNPGKVKEMHLHWLSRNPNSMRVHNQNRRALRIKNGGCLSRGLSERLFSLQKGRCACGCAQPLGDDYHLDHILPLILGGTNTDDNMQLLRAKCNLEKHAKHPVDFMQSRGFLI